MRNMTGGIVFLSTCALLTYSVCAEMRNEEKEVAYYRAWHNPKIRKWQEYPFVKKPENTLRTELWKDFKELPEELQRGRLIYKHEADMKNRGGFDEKSLKEYRNSGWSLIHIHTPLLATQEVQAVRKSGMRVVPRLDGKHFFGNNDIWRISKARGGISLATGFIPNHDWYRKFPPSLAANAVMRDGQLAFEYYGAVTQRRTCNVMHPVTIQLRDAFLREGLLGEQVFDIPLEPEKSGCFGGTWFDNPNNQVPSFDPYSREYTEKEFRKRFGEKYPGKENEMWYSDPPYFYIQHHDQDVMEWWEDFWAEAHAQYYAWQYKFINEELGPKLNMKHMFVGGNFKLCQDRAAWDYYAFSWDIADCMGPGESSHYYSEKYAVGYKVALAASNGKPGGLWAGNELESCEAVACLGVKTYLPDNLVAFQYGNKELFLNAKPGGRVAYLYHVEDGIHHNEVANMCRLTDQIWLAGVPLEIISERHLTQEVLKDFDVLVVPGFKFTARDIDGLRNYLNNGGKMILVGDNRDPEGKPLAEALAGLDSWQDAEKVVGKGKLHHFSTQLIAQEQMSKALENLGGTEGYRIIQPRPVNILMNVIRQPGKKLTGINLVNFSGAPVKDVRVKVPADLNATHAAYVSPYGGEKALSVLDNTITVDELPLYGLIVVCPDEKARDKCIAINKEKAFKPFQDKYPAAPVLKGPKDNEITLADLKTGQKLCYLRETGRCDLHRMEADIVTDGAGSVGKAQDIRLRIHRVAVHAPESVYVDQIAFVAVSMQDGSRQTIPVEMKLREGEKEEEVAVKAATFVRKDSTVAWTPEKPGRYQLYLSYRYVEEVFEGKPDSAASKRSKAGGNPDEFFWSVPLLKMVYENRLPCLTIEVR